MEPAASVALLLWWHPSIFLANALPLRNRALGAFHTIGGDETSVYEPLPADSPVSVTCCACRQYTAAVLVVTV